MIEWLHTNRKAKETKMTNYLITSDSATSNYLVALEDDFGFIPLFAVDDFDVAMGLVKLSEAEGLLFTSQTEKLIALN